MLNKLFKSILEQDVAPIIVCDVNHIIVYMNSSAIKRYHKDLTGGNIKDCHPSKANEMIDKVLANTLCLFRFIFRQIIKFQLS